MEGKLPEEEVAGREPGNQSQGGNEVQSSIQDKKGLVNVFNSALSGFLQSQARRHRQEGREVRQGVPGSEE